MAIQYKWVISAMDTAPSEDELTDVVKSVHWRRQAIEQSEVDLDKYYMSDVFDVLSCESPDPMAFTPYQDLTFEDVCGWLEENLDVIKLDESLAAQIESQKNPPIVQLPLPWAPKQVVEQPVVEEPSEQQSGL